MSDLSEDQIESLRKGAECKMGAAAQLLTEASAYLLAAGLKRASHWCATEALAVNLRKDSEAEECSPSEIVEASKS